MRRSANALSLEPDEAPVSSNETLEANVAAIRVDLNELKTNFSIAIARIDTQIKVAVSELKAEIGVMAEKAASTVERVAGVERQLTEMRAEDKSLRDKVDENYKTLSNKIDENTTTLSNRIEETRKTLTDKIDENHKTVTAKMDENHKTLSAQFITLDGKMTKIASDRAALSWVIGGRGVGRVIPWAICMFGMVTLCFAMLVIGSKEQNAPQEKQATQEQAQLSNESLHDVEKSDEPSSAAPR